MSGAVGVPADIVRFEGVTKRFGDHAAVDGVSLTIREGEFFALLGPSGCGKTTLMRLLAGFEAPDAGRILLDGRDIAGLPPHRRPVHMMFQSYALFPHLSVAANIAYGLRGLPRAEAAERVEEMLALVKLEGLGARKPHQLSGGQQQRVAIARAIVTEPQVLLADEPTGNLDTERSREIMQLLEGINRDGGITILMVTHEPDMAAFARTIIRFRDGLIESIEASHQMGAPVA